MYHPINKTHISIYVDDLLITATDQKYIDDLMKYLTYCYGELNNIKRNNNDEIEYIGLFIKKYKNDKTIKIYQKNLIKKNLEINKPNNILEIPYKNDIDNLDDLNDLDNNNSDNNISKLMSLMYISQRTRPDISFPLYYLLKKKNRNNNSEININNIYSYIKYTPDLGISFTTTNLNLYGWVDYNEFNQLIIIVSFGRIKANLIFYTIKQLDIDHYLYKNDDYGDDEFGDKFNIINSDKIKKKIINISFMNIIIIKNIMKELGYYQNKITVYLNLENKKIHNLIKLIDNEKIINSVEFEYMENNKMLTNILSTKLNLDQFKKKCSRIF